MTTTIPHRRRWPPTCHHTRTSWTTTTPAKSSMTTATPPRSSMTTMLGHVDNDDDNTTMTTTATRLPPHQDVVDNHHPHQVVDDDGHTTQVIHDDNARPRRQCRGRPGQQRPHTPHIHDVDNAATSPTSMT